MPTPRSIVLALGLLLWSPCLVSKLVLTASDGQLISACTNPSNGPAAACGSSAVAPWHRDATAMAPSWQPAPMCMATNQVMQQSPFPFWLFACTVLLFIGTAIGVALFLSPPQSTEPPVAWYSSETFRTPPRATIFNKSLPPRPQPPDLRSNNFSPYQLPPFLPDKPQHPTHQTPTDFNSNDAQHRQTLKRPVVDPYRAVQSYNKGTERNRQETPSTTTTSKSLVHCQSSGPEPQPQRPTAVATLTTSVQPRGTPPPRALLPSRTMSEGHSAVLRTLMLLETNNTATAPKALPAPTKRHTFTPKRYVDGNASDGGGGGSSDDNSNTGRGSRQLVGITNTPPPHTPSPVTDSGEVLEVSAGSWAAETPPRLDAACLPQSWSMPGRAWVTAAGGGTAGARRQLFPMMQQQQQQQQLAVASGGAPRPLPLPPPPRPTASREEYLRSWASGTYGYNDADELDVSVSPVGGMYPRNEGGRASWLGRGMSEGGVRLGGFRIGESGNAMTLPAGRTLALPAATTPTGGATRTSNTVHKATPMPLPSRPLMQHHQQQQQNQQRPWRATGPNSALMAAAAQPQQNRFPLSSRVDAGAGSLALPPASRSAVFTPAAAPTTPQFPPYNKSYGTYGNRTTPVPRQQQPQRQQLQQQQPKGYQLQPLQPSQPLQPLQGTGMLPSRTASVGRGALARHMSVRPATIPEEREEAGSVMDLSTTTSVATTSTPAAKEATADPYFPRAAMSLPVVTTTATTTTAARGKCEQPAMEDVLSSLFRAGAASVMDLSSPSGASPVSSHMPSMVSIPGMFGSMGTVHGNSTYGNSVQPAVRAAAAGAGRAPVSGAATVVPELSTPENPWTGNWAHFLAIGEEGGGVGGGGEVALSDINGGGVGGGGEASAGDRPVIDVVTTKIQVTPSSIPTTSPACHADPTAATYAAFLGDPDADIDPDAAIPEAEQVAASTHPELHIPRQLTSPAPYDDENELSSDEKPVPPAAADADLPPPPPPPPLVRTWSMGTGPFTATAAAASAAADPTSDSAAATPRASAAQTINPSHTMNFTSVLYHLQRSTSQCSEPPMTGGEPLLTTVGCAQLSATLPVPPPYAVFAGPGGEELCGPGFQRDPGALEEQQHHHQSQPQALAPETCYGFLVEGASPFDCMVGMHQQEQSLSSAAAAAAGLNADPTLCSPWTSAMAYMPTGATAADENMGGGAADMEEGNMGDGDGGGGGRDGGFYPFGQPQLEEGDDLPLPPLPVPPPAPLLRSCSIHADVFTQRLTEVFQSAAESGFLSRTNSMDAGCMDALPPAMPSMRRQPSLRRTPPAAAPPPPPAALTANVSPVAAPSPLRMSVVSSSVAASPSPSLLPPRRPSTVLPRNPSSLHRRPPIARSSRQHLHQTTQQSPLSLPQQYSQASQLSPSDDQDDSPRVAPPYPNRPSYLSPSPPPSQRSLFAPAPEGAATATATAQSVTQQSYGIRRTMSDRRAGDRRSGGGGGTDGVEPLAAARRSLDESRGVGPACSPTRHHASTISRPPPPALEAPQEAPQFLPTPGSPISPTVSNDGIGSDDG